MWILKSNTNESIYETKQTHRYTRQTYGFTQGDEVREWHGHIQTTIYKIDN